ncbi:ead/Ea22-like family protein [Klebsiella pneumoniae]|uniref:ead/Ea22-like family protein n=1 Tax=Klebsiella pneumoniae TaxID=573 RepID=UPI0013C40D3E
MAWDETAQRNAEFIALANPANVLALVEALEKAQAENTAGVAGMAESYETTISMLRSRIAELESRTVKLPDFRHERFNSDWGEHDAEAYQVALREALTAAGIKVEAE